MITVDENTLRLVANRIAERARSYGLAPNGVTPASLRPFHSTSTYPLYLAEIATGTGKPQRVVVKFAPIYGEHREGLAEFVNLTAMSERLGDSTVLRVPRALDYFEDVNALITEHRPGPRFSTQMLASSPVFASAGARSALARTAQQCGEWLRIYHGVMDRGLGPALDERFVANLRRDLGRLPARGPLQALRVPIENFLTECSERMRERRVPVAVRHGDFSPDNVHLDGEGICVFDLSHHKTAAVYDDLTFFLVTLDTINPYPRYLAFDRRVAQALAGPFLDGYFGAERAARERADGDVIAAYTVMNLLARCLRQRRVAAGAGPIALAAFDALWVSGRYRGLIARAIARASGHGRAL